MDMRASPATSRAELPPLKALKPVLSGSRGNLKPFAAKPRNNGSLGPPLAVKRAVVEQPSEDSALEALVLGLRRLAAGKPADFSAVQRLAAEGDGAALGCLRTARALGKLFAAAPAAPGRDPSVEGGGVAEAPCQQREELEAQVAFLEGKVSKLREKLQKRKDDKSEAASAGPKRAALAAEVQRLQAEVDGLAAAGPAGGVPGGAEALRQRATGAKGQAAALRAEKEAAEAKEALARRLVTGVEARLQEMVRVREAEQSRLLESQRLLRKGLEVQAPQLSWAERRREARREAAEARVLLANREEELEAELQQERYREQVLQELVEATHKAATRIQANHRGNMARKQLSVERGAEPSRQELLERCTEELDELRRLEDQLDRRQQELQEELASRERRAEELESDLQRLNQDAELSMSRLATEHQAAVETLELHMKESVTMSAEEERAELSQIAAARDAALERHQELRQEASTTQQLQAGRETRETAEAWQALEDGEHVRRAAEFAGATWLVVRRSAFCQEVMFATLSDVLELPQGHFRLLDTDARPEEEPPQRAPTSAGAAAGRPPRGGAPSREEAANEEQPQDLLDARDQLARAGGPSRHGATEAPAAPLRGTRQIRRVSKQPGRCSDHELEPVGEDDDGAPVEQQSSGSNAQQAQAQQSSGSWRSRPAALASPSSSRGFAAAAPSGRPSTTGTVQLLGESLVPVDELGEDPPGAQARRPAVEKLDPSLRCVLLEIADGDLTSDTRVALATKLRGLIERGDPRLEHLAIVRAAVARGERTPRHAWPEESTCVVERATQSVSGWTLVVSVYSALDVGGSALKLAALDVGGSGDEFLLHLHGSDLEALAPGAASLPPGEAAKAVMSSLRVVTREGRRFLVAAHTAQAPPTVANEIVPLVTELGKLSAGYRQAQRAVVYEKRKLKLRAAPLFKPPRPPPPQAEPPVLTLHSAAGDGAAGGAHAWEAVWEEVVEFGGRFVLLWVERSGARRAGVRALRLTLQEAGRCEPFHMMLVGQGAERRHSVCAQLCQFGDLSLMVLAEEVTVPPVVVVRVAQACASSRAEASLLCLSSPAWEPVDRSVLLRIPPQTRGLLLNFLLEAPAGARAAVEGSRAGEMARAGRPCSLGGGREGRWSRQAGLACVLAPRPAWATRPGGRRRRGGPGPAWELLAQGGRRVPVVDRSGGGLHVVRVFHRSDPLSHFLVLAFEVGRGREWRLVVGSEDAQACVAVPGGAGGAAAVAAALLGGCVFCEAEGEKTLTLPRAGAKSGCLKVAQLALRAPGTEGSQAPAAGPGGATLQLAVSAPQAAATGAGAPMVGGRFVELARDDEREDPREHNRPLQVAVRRISSLDLVISLEGLPSGRGSALSAYHAATCSRFEVSMGTGSCSCPEKFCVERVNMCGVPVVFALSEAAFPHAVQAIVRGPQGSREFRCTVRDEGLFAMLPQSQRRLFAVSTTELLQQGFVGDGGAGPPPVNEVACGDLGEVDVGAVTLLRVPLDDFSSLGPPVASTPICQGLAALGGSRFHISLVRAHEDGRPAFVMGLGLEGSTQARAIRLGWRDHAEIGQWQVSLYGEVCDVGGTNVLVLVLLDPASARVAVVEPSSRQVAQLVVLNPQDEETTDGGLLPSDLVRGAREDVLRAFQTSSFAPVDMGAHQVAATQPETGAPKEASVVLCRSTHQLPSGQPVLLSVLREPPAPDGPGARCSVRMYHAQTGREATVAVSDALLDKVLADCMLSDCWSSRAEAVDANRLLVGRQILAHVRVHPDGSGLEVEEEQPQPPPEAPALEEEEQPQPPPEAAALHV